MITLEFSPLTFHSNKRIGSLALQRNVGTELKDLHLEFVWCLNALNERPLQNWHIVAGADVLRKREGLLHMGMLQPSCCVKVVLFSSLSLPSFLLDWKTTGFLQFSKLPSLNYASMTSKQAVRVCGIFLKKFQRVSVSESKGNFFLMLSVLVGVGLQTKLFALRLFPCCGNVRKRDFTQSVLTDPQGLRISCR